MTALYHLGLEPEDVPAGALLIEAAIDPEAAAGDARFLGSRREYRCWLAGDVLVATCGLGAPPLAIAVEELARAGARRFVLLASYVPAAGGPSVLVPAGAVRGDGTSAQYAPPEYPAVPAFALAQRLRAELGVAAERNVVATTDVLNAAQCPPGACGTDRSSACLFVVAAARGVQGAAVLVADQSDAAAVGTAVLRVLREE